MLKAYLFTGLQCVAKCGVTYRTRERHFLLSTRYKNVTQYCSLREDVHIYTLHTHTHIHIHIYTYVCIHIHLDSYILVHIYRLSPVYGFCINGFSSMLSLLSWGAKRVIYSLIVWYVALYLFLGYQVGWTFSRGCIVSCMS